jgi:hypothetical protein
MITAVRSYRIYTDSVYRDTGIMHGQLKIKTEILSPSRWFNLKDVLDIALLTSGEGFLNSSGLTVWKLPNWISNFVPVASQGVDLKGLQE